MTDRSDKSRTSMPSCHPSFQSARLRENMHVDNYFPLFYQAFLGPSLHPPVARVDFEKREVI